MDYEKAYKEALERAKSFKTPELRDVAEYIFPELKEESEDEKIRKELIDIVAKSPITFAFEDKNKVLSWLERQGEKKPADKVEPIFEVGDTMRTLQEASNGIREGTPVVVSIDNEYYRCNNETIAIKDQNNYEYPPINKRHNAWSEEDENTIKVLMNIIRKSEIIDSIIYTDSLKEKLYDWLKSLRPQPKQEWSEEDEKMLNRIIEDFSDGKVSNILEVYWLKSIKQRIGG